MHARLAQFLAIGMVLFSGALSPQSTLVTFVERGSNKLYIGANREYSYVLVLASWNRPALVPRLEGIEGVQEASRWLPAKAELDIRGSSISTWALGVGPGLPGQVNSGRFFTTAELEQGAGVCLLESSLLPRLSVDHPQELLGKEIAVRIGDGTKPLNLRVVGTYTRVPTEGPSSNLATHPFLTTYMFLLDGGEGLVVPYKLLTRYVQEEIQSFFVNVEPSVGASRVFDTIDKAFRSGDLQSWGSTRSSTQLSEADMGNASTSDQSGAGWLEQLPPGLTIVVFLILLLGVGPCLVHLGFRWIMHILTKKYGPTFPHDVMEVVTATLVVVWAIGAGVMGLALLLAHPQTIPREQTGLIPGLGTIPLGQMVAAFEQSPLARTHFILIRVLGVLLVVASIAASVYAVRHRISALTHVVLPRLKQYAYALVLVTITFVAGLSLIISSSVLSAHDTSHISPVTAIDHRIIEIYKPSYLKVQERNQGLIPEAVPVAASLVDQQREFDTASLQELKSLTSGIDYVYSTRTLSTQWQQRSIEVMEATRDFFTVRDWELWAGQMPEDSTEVLVDATALGIIEPQQAREWLGKTVSLTILGEGQELRIVGVVKPETGHYAPAILRPAPDGRMWTSAVAIARPDQDPIAVAGALQQALDRRYGQYVWRVEARQSQTQRLVEIHGQTQAAGRWFGIVSLLLVLMTVFGITHTSERKASPESTPGQPLQEGGGVSVFRRAAYHVTLGLAGGLLGAGTGHLVFPRLPLPLLTTANAQAQLPGVLQGLLVAAAVGATTLIGSLGIVWHPRPMHVSRSGQRTRLRHLLRTRSSSILALLVLAVGVGLLVSYASNEEVVRQAIAEAKPYGYLQLFPLAAENTYSGSAPIGWALADLETIRPYLPDQDDVLALARSVEAYIHDQTTQTLYSALVVAGSAELPEVRGWRLAAGRSLSGQEIADRERVAVVSREFGRLLWGGNDPEEYVGRSLSVRFAHVRETEYEQFTVVGVMDWATLAQKWGGGASAMPALFIPLGLSPQATLPDGTILGRSLEVRSPDGDNSKLGSALQQLASALLRPTYGLIDTRDVRPTSPASSRFTVYKQVLWVQVLAILLMAATSFFALRWLDVASPRAGHEVPAVREGSRRWLLLRDSAVDSGLVLVAGCLLGLLVAVFFAPHLIRPFLVGQVFLTTDADSLPVLTRQGAVTGIVAVAIATTLLSLYPAWQAAEGGHRPSMSVR